MPVIVSIILFVICFIALCGFLTGITSYLITYNQKIDSANLMYLQLVMFVSVLLSVVIVNKIDRVSFSSLGFSIHKHVSDLFYGFIVAVLFYIIGFGVSLLTGIIQIESIHLSWANLFYSFLFFILVSFSEEIMCRGFILGRLLGTRLNKFVSLIISSLVFAVMHLFNPNISFLPMLNLFIAGLMLGVVYIYTRNLWFPISLHLFWNWIQGPVLGYEVSGNNLYPSLFKLSLPNENIWNGGLFGFEGSIICTILMLLFVFLVIFYFENKVYRHSITTEYKK